MCDCPHHYTPKEVLKRNEKVAATQGEVRAVDQKGERGGSHCGNPAERTGKVNLRQVLQWNTGGKCGTKKKSRDNQASSCLWMNKSPTLTKIICLAVSCRKTCRFPGPTPLVSDFLTSSLGWSGELHFSSLKLSSPAKRNPSLHTLFFSTFLRAWWRNQSRSQLPCLRASSLLMSLTPA